MQRKCILQENDSRKTTALIPKKKQQTHATLWKKFDIYAFVILTKIIYGIIQQQVEDHLF